MKTIQKSIIAFLLVFIAFGCSEDFIDVNPKGTFLEDNYYRNEEQAFAGLISVYDVMRKQSGGFENMVAMLNAGSDDFYAGGGGATDGTGIQSFSNYTMTSATIPASFWNDFYQGIFRANTLLIKLPGVPMDENTKKRFAAEAKALRAHYYFELLRTFRNIPLITAPVPTSEIYNVPQADPADVYAQIETDLMEALVDLPPMITSAELGRLSRGAAQALLGKVYLYQGKNSLAATEFAEVNGTPGGTSQYGYKLLDSYASLWSIDNKFNTESIMEVSHTAKSNTGWGNWGSGSDEGNSLNTMLGPRGYVRTGGSTAPDYATGWSFNTVTENLYDVLKADPRFDATIADVKALVEAGQATYTPGYMDTGYFLKKFMPLTTDVTPGGELVLNYRQNSYIIRLADSYLMEAEALGGSGIRAQQLLDAVRARVGLASIPVSMEAIMNERRLELAGEGHRWFDLVRTGRASQVLSTRGFVAGKNEIWPIPFRELENTLIEQNPLYN
ncbi:MAG: RagB/SusD family nutrient uptake outer membrane protein [Flavobacterium sp.]|nr:MAG: RagB/SusD family nutrient uptake outer membrane protein [Flavobacterium sp.]